MGISSASIYNAFGDKKRLFERSLQQYLNCSSRRRIAALDEAEHPLLALEEFLDAIVEASARNSDGCLLINSAVELAAHDDDIRSTIAAGLGEVEAALARTIHRGQEAGAIPSGLDAATHARAMLGCMIAIRVMSRTGASVDYLRALAETQIEPLRASRLETEREWLQPAP